MKRAALLALAMALPAPVAAQTEVVIVTKSSSFDDTAWHEFVRMVRPARDAKGVEFETWASDADLYGPHPHWPAANAPKLLTRSIGGAASRRGLPQVAAPGSCARPLDGAAGNFPPDACIGEEVRHDRDVFDYLTSNGLTTVKGLVAAYARHQAVSLPLTAIVAKADWVPVADIIKWQPAYKNAADVRRAFYTNTARLNGTATEFALVGMSVQSKMMQDWLWFTVEHRSNPGRCDIIGCHDVYGARVANVVAAAKPNTDYGPCAKTPALEERFAQNGIAPVWNNYCLKGTQTRYLDSKGTPTLLGNSVVERMNHGVPIAHISCITCHAYAGFDRQGHPNGKVLPMQPIGAVDQSLMQGYDGADFLWGILSAK